VDFLRRRLKWAISDGENCPERDSKHIKDEKIRDTPIFSCFSFGILEFWGHHTIQLALVEILLGEVILPAIYQVLNQRIEYGAPRIDRIEISLLILSDGGILPFEWKREKLFFNLDMEKDK
jgi:hypothetical protein